jgi:hypothetical protein
MKALSDMYIEQALLPENLSLGVTSSTSTPSPATASSIPSTPAPSFDFNVGDNTSTAGLGKSVNTGINNMIGSATMQPNSSNNTANVNINLEVSDAFLSSADNARAMGKALGEAIKDSFRSQGGMF